MTLQGKNPGFKRNVYKLLDCERDCVLLHYIGDHNIGSQYPHGNSKSQNIYIYKLAIIINYIAIVSNSLIASY